MLKGLTSETKVFLGIIIATVFILAGAVFLFSKNDNSTSTNTQKANQDLLIRPDSDKISSSSANITLVEFADYQCPACGAYHPILKQLLIDFAGRLNFVYRNFPLSQHQNAPIAAYAAQASGLQGKFWPMHDMLYENQAKWSDENKARDTFIQYAQTLGLNIDQFKKDLDAASIRQKIGRDVQDGNALGVNATPTFYLDNQKLENPQSLSDFETLIKAEILKAPISQSPSEKYHVHANIKVYLDGRPADFSQAKYQGTADGKDLDENIHFHDGNGDIIHIHKKGVTLGQFLKSLKITLSSDCLILDTGENYCSGNGKTLQMFVNGKKNTQFGNFVPQDLDRILVSFGGASSDAELQKQINSVADTACIYSLKCPERGTPPPEKCAGTLGSNCNE